MHAEMDSYMNCYMYAETGGEMHTEMYEIRTEMYPEMHAEMDQTHVEITTEMY